MHACLRFGTKWRADSRAVSLGASPFPHVVLRNRGKGAGWAMAHIQGDPNIIIFIERMHIELIYINTYTCVQYIHISMVQYI